MCMSVCLSLCIYLSVCLSICVCVCFNNVVPELKPHLCLAGAPLELHALPCLPFFSLRQYLRAGLEPAV